MKMTLIQFYKSILKPLNIEVSDTNFLQIRNGETLVDLTRRKGMLVSLPTKENLEKMYVRDDSGKYKPEYLIFNPLSEYSYEDGVGLEIIRESIIIGLSGALHGFGNLLLLTYMDSKLQGDLPIELNEFIASAKDSSIVGMKASGKAVDDTMISTWNKLIDSYIRSIEKDLFTLLIPRTKSGSNKNTREAKLTCSLYEDLLEAEIGEDKVKINGINIRPKEVKIFRDILKLFMVGANEKGLIKVGTEDVDAPGFVVLFKLLDSIMTKVNRWVASMSLADTVIATDSIIEFDIKMEDILNAASIYKQELLLIPNENEVNIGSDVANAKKGVNLNLNNLHPTVQKALTEPQVLQPDRPKDPMDALLNKNRGLNQFGQPMMQQMIPMQNIQAQQTNMWMRSMMGQSQQVVQPVMQQPIMQQHPLAPNMVPNQMGAQVIGQPMMPVQNMTVPQPMVTTVQSTLVNTAPKMVSRLTPGLNDPSSMAVYQQEQMMKQQQLAQQQPMYSGYGSIMMPHFGR